MTDDMFSFSVGTGVPDGPYIVDERQHGYF